MINIDRVFFWTDSSCVLNYIHSNDGRFQRFVANRVAYIRSHTDVSQWFHVPGSLNPADLLSRGVNCAEKFIQCEQWVRGPDFLLLDSSAWPKFDVGVQVEDDEIIKNTVCATSVVPMSASNRLLNSTSDWFKLKLRVCVYIKFSQFISGVNFDKRMSVVDTDNAEICIFRYLQQTYMGDLYRDLCKRKLPKKHALVKLGLFVDSSLVVRVGGRLENAPDIAYAAKHPVLLPKAVSIVRVYVEYVHKKLGHLGRECVLAHLRQTVHIIGVNTLIKDVIRKCIVCRKVQGAPVPQLMADLPADRLEHGCPAFTNTGVDYFGPFFVTRGRTKEKRYGVIFSCLVSRAAHIEISHSLDTDSFLNALRRFTARRGNVQVMRSDNGTNLVAGSKELKDCLKKWNDSAIDVECHRRGIDWKFQPATASHFGGVFEREIRTIRKILNSTSIIKFLLLTNC